MAAGYFLRIGVVVDEIMFVLVLVLAELQTDLATRRADHQLKCLRRGVLDSA
jgi:hypothetical protein